MVGDVNRRFWFLRKINRVRYFEAKIDQPMLNNKASHIYMSLKSINSFKVFEKEIKRNEQIKKCFSSTKGLQVFLCNNTVSKYINDSTK